MSVADIGSILPVYNGLPLFWQLWFTVTLVVVLFTFVWKACLFWRSGIWYRRVKHEQASRDPTYADPFNWIFLVPALNEEVTIRDSIGRLLEVEARNKLIVVIDDGSDDATAGILASLDLPELHVIRRELPDARTGKGAALNAAFAHLPALVKRRGWSRQRVIVTIVDADGRLAANAAQAVGPHFEDASVGGVQILVRIYNRTSPLTWAQDVEFRTFGYLYQSARSIWGGALMGGNGQMNRLTALEDVATEDGPWNNTATEDLDLGLRMLLAGWRNVHELGTDVRQQGLNSPRQLLRQRIRWSLGNLQAASLTRALWLGPFSRGTRIEALAFLYMPLLQGMTGIAFIGSIYLLISGVASYIPSGTATELLLVVIVVYVLGIGGTMMGCIAAARGEGPTGYLRAFFTANAYAVYTWLLWPALFVSSFRFLTGRVGWQKTEREPLPIITDADSAAHGTTIEDESNDPQRSSRYRPDIQGLRAIAILLVLFDHLGVSGFSGGFIGVDIFFVISGYLITRLLITEYRASRDGKVALASGTISISSFYKRRARRILPAAVFVIAVVLVGGKFSFNAVRFEQLQVDAFWAALFAANFQLMAQASDYFAAGNLISPLRNYWSLAVEEQFYLVWPALFLLIGRFSFTRDSMRAGAWQTRILVAVALVGIASLAWSVHATAENPFPAFFSPFTRSWELALGAAIALSLRLRDGVGAGASTVAALTGTALIVISLVVINPQTPFPGLIALLPTTAAALLIVAGINAEQKTVVATVLAARPMQFFGRVSYSLYLWHWPIIIFAAALVPLSALDGGLRIAVLFALSVTAGWASYRLIEQPFRIHQSEARSTDESAPPEGAQRPQLRRAGFAAAAALPLLAIALFARPTLPAGPIFGVGTASAIDVAGDPGAQSIVAARWEALLSRSAAQQRASVSEVAQAGRAASQTPNFSCHDIVDDADLRRCRARGTSRTTVRANRSIKSVALIGDSYAAQYRVGILAALPATTTLTQLTLSACSSAVAADDEAKNSNGDSCADHARFVRQRLRRLHPDLLIFSTTAEESSASIRRLFQELRSSAEGSLWIGFAPSTPTFASCLQTGSEIAQCNGPVDRELERNDEYIALARSSAVDYLDLAAVFCIRGVCPAFIGGQVVRTDGRHLTRQFLPKLNRFLRDSIFGAK